MHIKFVELLVPMQSIVYCIVGYLHGVQLSWMHDEPVIFTDALFVT